MSERVVATELKMGDVVTVEGRRVYVVGAVPTSDAETLLVLMVSTDTEFTLTEAGDNQADDDHADDEHHHVPRWW